MVKDNDVESAMRVLNGIMANEGMFQRWMLTRRQVPELAEMLTWLGFVYLCILKGCAL
jgi:uncharacterized protein YjiS (DUF1127 family)